MWLLFNFSTAFNSRITFRQLQNLQYTDVIRYVLYNQLHT